MVYLSNSLKDILVRTLILFRKNLKMFNFCLTLVKRSYESQSIKNTKNTLINNYLNNKYKEKFIKFEYNNIFYLGMKSSLIKIMNKKPHE